MSIDFSQKIIARDNVPFLLDPGARDETGKVIREPIEATLGIICAMALERFKAPEIPWRENLKLARLSEKLQDAKEPIELTAAEINMLVENVGRWPQLRIASEAVRMLDPAAWEKAA